MKYLLDTNACIRLLNSSSDSLVNHMRQMRPSEICLCSVVKAELVYGALRSACKAENLRLLNRFFRAFPSVSFDDACADAYGAIRNELESVGTPIGPNDLMIAAIARTNDLILITHNVKEFSRVIGLDIEDWEV